VDDLAHYGLLRHETKIPFSEGYMKVVVDAEDCLEVRIKLVLVMQIYVVQVKNRE
jgi:hypothetical protein